MNNEQTKCPPCGGTGWRISNWAHGLNYRCEKCKGTGLISETSAQLEADAVPPDAGSRASSQTPNSPTFVNSEHSKADGQAAASELGPFVGDGEQQQGLKLPPLEDQIAFIEDAIAALRDSFTDRIGPTLGQITEPGIAYEIKCLEASVLILNWLKGAAHIIDIPTVWHVEVRPSPTTQAQRRRAATKTHENQNTYQRGSSFDAAHGSPSLTWTVEKPRASGMWWWWNLDPKCAPDMVEVRASDVLSWCGLGPTMHWPGLTRVRNVMTVGGVWAGPVNPPETPSAETTAKGSAQRIGLLA